MKKQLTDFIIVENQQLSPIYGLLGVTPADKSQLPPMNPGQFVEISAPKSSGVMLRRPISIHDVDTERNILWLLIRRAGDGTAAMIDSPIGTILNILLPLGNGFSMPEKEEKALLIGGGVGVAPLLYFGKKLAEQGIKPAFLLGARTEADMLRGECFEAVGDTYYTTEDGSIGEKGFVTNHSILNNKWDKIYCCGPVPMMKAVAKIAYEKEIFCEVSLENMMACGLGACLCCVEKTVKGNICVCSDGPVFNINQLLWQN